MCACTVQVSAAPHTLVKTWTKQRGQDYVSHQQTGGREGSVGDASGQHALSRASEGKGQPGV